MPTIEVQAVSAAFAAAGTTRGVVQVASTTGFYAGCEAFVTATALPTKRCIIVAIVDATHLTLRVIADDNENQLPVQVYGGGSDLSAYTNVNSAKVWQQSQLARVEINTTAPASLNK